jgi:hypothetical protein
MAPQKGTATYNAKLSEEQVRLARIYVMQGPIGTLPQLARRWQVGRQALRNACNGKNWKHIAPPTPEEIANTPLPNWIDLGKAPHRARCGQCVHWEDGRSCTLTIPEAGGFFASSCASYWVGK